MDDVRDVLTEDEINELLGDDRGAGGNADDECELCCAPAQLQAVARARLRRAESWPERGWWPSTVAVPFGAADGDSTASASALPQTTMEYAAFDYPRSPVSALTCRAVAVGPME
ncbi:hypothetical protein [Streptomyces mirabilis]|uniref:hypothetical protein n=1 Tax=Streptomyces mirabilis TaxID=68239 RepID=UPI0033D3FF96